MMIDMGNLQGFVKRKMVTQGDEDDMAEVKVKWNQIERQMHTLPDDFDLVMMTKPSHEENDLADPF